MYSQAFDVEMYPAHMYYQHSWKFFKVASGEKRVNMVTERRQGCPSTSGLLSRVYLPLDHKSLS